MNKHDIYAKRLQKNTNKDFKKETGFSTYLDYFKTIAHSNVLEELIRFKENGRVQCRGVTLQYYYICVGRDRQSDANALISVYKEFILNE